MDNVIFLLVLLAVAIVSYLSGSVNGAIITSKYFYRKDIRKYGSGNPGLTNFYRVFGKGGTTLVILIDVMKSLVPVFVSGLIFEQHFDALLFGRISSGLFVMLGHCFPVYYAFKGGKGVMAAGTVIFVIDWRVALISWGLFLIISAITRFVSLGSIIAGIAFPISLSALNLGDFWEVFIACLCMTLLIARHQANIKRLIKGEESRFSFKRKKPEGNNL